MTTIPEPLAKPKLKYGRNRRPKLKKPLLDSDELGLSTNNGNNKEMHSPKVHEIKKLIKRFPPVSVNGINTESLSVPVIEFIKRNEDQDIYLMLNMVPSDPDFPFELASLKFSLFIPQNYPHYTANSKSNRPSIVVLNKDIPRGFSVNIEIGFTEIISKCIEQKLKKRNKKHKQKTVDLANDTILIDLVQGADLLSVILTLDKYLDEFLSREKKDTIKIVRHKKTNAKSVTPEPVPSPSVLRETVKPQKVKVQIPLEISDLRSREIHKLLTRLESQLNIRRFKTTDSNDIYSMNIPLTNTIEPKGLVVEVSEDVPLLIVDTLPCRLYIPKEYLFNDKKPIKLEVDKSFMIRSVEKYDQHTQKLELSKRINLMISNFNDIVSVLFLKENLQSLQDLKHSLTSQINFFIYNSQSLINNDLEFLTI